MHWKDMHSRGFIEINNQQKCLKHLLDVKFEYKINATSKHNELEFECLVQFSSHCISWGPGRGQVINFAEYGEDHRIIDDKGIHRCFCSNRYELSLKLPEIFKTILERNCYFTGYENWMTIEVINRNIAQDYEIFFNVTKKSKKLLRIYVESAYIRRESDLARKPSPSRRDKIKGVKLLSKKLRGEAIRRPRN